MSERSEPWVVWSIEHDAWWAPNARGYCTSLFHAGVYSEAEALKHAANPQDELAMPLSVAIAREHKGWSRAGTVDEYIFASDPLLAGMVRLGVDAWESLVQEPNAAPDPEAA